MIPTTSYMLNRPPTATTSTSYTKNIKVIDFDNSKPQNNVDLSWLPNYNDNNFGSHSDNSNDQNGQKEFDDSWLPTYNYTKRNISTATTPSISNDSNRSRKTKSDSDDNSWFPSIPNLKNESRNNGQNNSHDSWLPNHNHTKKNTSTIVPKSSYSNRSRIIENDSDNSWLPPTTVRNGDKKKENNTNLKNLRNQDHWDRAREVGSFSGDRHVQNAKLSNKKREPSGSQRQVSSSKTEFLVETDSLGGVSTLLRRWKDFDETKNFRNSSDTPQQKLGSTFTSPCRADDSCLDFESCKTSPSMPISCVTSSRSIKDSKAGDAKEEKTRVVDIARKLSVEEDLAASQAATNTLDGRQVVGEHKCFSPVVGKTRLIRGRQAFKDFLYLMEQDRLRELETLTQRKLVTKFPNRGRIQASLRVKIIRHGIERDKETKSQKRSVSRTMKTIWDKFSAGVKQGASSSRKVHSNREGTKTYVTPELSVSCYQVREVEVNAPTTISNNQEMESVTTCNQSAQEAKDHQEVIESTIDKAQDINSSPNLIENNEDTHYEIQVLNRSDYHENGLDNSVQLHSEIEIENPHQWFSEYSQSQSDWDEDEEFYYNHDWISEIARPKSDWECMRQKRYQEMLHNYSYNQDVQELLQRKSVSSFLSSGLRENLDQLMVSRSQGVSCKQEVVVRELRRQEVDGRRKIERKCSDGIDQNTCSSVPPQSRTWSHPTPAHESNQMTSPSLPLWQNNAPQSSSIEMELIYDLRGYVEQLHQEIVELRKLVKLQQSVEKNKSERIGTKRNCCVCYAVQADSFLYRCGHMCTCYNCGVDLQCTSGKCPICEAPIMDVVSAYGYDK